jgi:hypothetical protein
MKNQIHLMKHPLSAGLCLLLLAGNARSAQDQSPAKESPDVSVNRATVPEKAALTKFDLDFPGGTPQQLLDAVQKATGHRVNAIIPEDVASLQLPALKMKHVDVAELFQALRDSSRSAQVSRLPGSPVPVTVNGYGFNPASSPVNEDTIWNFYAVIRSTASPETRTCRFYSLAPYLAQPSAAGEHAGKPAKGLTVDDIMTAIETGWKMLGDTNPPTVKFHKDTGLLIAVGEPRQLMIIDSALRALESQAAASGGGGGGGEPQKSKNAQN